MERLPIFSRRICAQNPLYKLNKKLPTHKGSRVFLYTLLDKADIAFGYRLIAALLRILAVVNDLHVLVEDNQSSSLWQSWQLLQTLCQAVYTVVAALWQLFKGLTCIVLQRCFIAVEVGLYIADVYKRQTLTCAALPSASETSIGMVTLVAVSLTC